MAQTEMPELPVATDSSQVSESDIAATAEGNADDSALKKRLLSRIAVAGVVILGLLGGLAMFDVLNKPQAPALPKMAATPIARIEPPEPAIKAEDKKSAAELVAEDKGTDAVPERTESVLAPLPSAKPLTPPAIPRSASIKPPSHAPVMGVPPKQDAAREIARVIPERTAPAQAASHAPASRPLTAAAEGAQRFLVQVGVFSNHVNAEELVTKLQAAGIPAQIESRVQVGPFASRVEADAARTKLKALGFDDGLLVRR